MFRSLRTYKLAFIFFIGLSIALVLAGILDFLFRGHESWQSHVYLFAAFITAFCAAIVRRVQCSSAGGAGDRSKRVSLPKASIWLYGGVAIYTVVYILYLFTDFLRTPIIRYLTIIVLMSVIGKIIFDQYQFYSKAGFKLTSIHRIGIAFAVGVFAFFVYLLVARVLN